MTPVFNLNSTSAAILEKVVLHKSKEIFQPTKNWKSPAILNAFTTQKRSSVYESGVGTLGIQPLVKNKFISWWQPPKDNILVEFCEDTSIHGLKFVVKRKSHIAERIFWVIAFLFGLIAAVLLINDVWVRYHKNPVIVTFEPKELDIDGLPFPAITLCNINKFSKSKVLETERIAAEGSETARKHLKFVRNVCNAQQSFAKEFNFAGSRGTLNFEDENDTITDDDQEEMLDFIFEFTVPCHDMIRLCMFAEKIYPCDKIFKSFITDYGKCCSFNIMPFPLLMKDQRENETNKKLNSIWSQREIERWKQWKYTDGMILPKNLSRPYRQNRAGSPYGLSILIDANVEEYFCPASDSEGFRFSIHAPLEMPHIAEFANVLEINREIYVEINPEVINAEDDVKAYHPDDRKCFFENEKNLTFFYPYTAKNCIDECTAQVITRNCSCSYFYMPRHDGVKVCSTAKNHEDAKCIQSAKVSLLDTLKEICGHCNSLCENIEFHYQTTMAKIQKSLWDDTSGNKSVPNWANNTMSIVHIFFGSDSTVPKLRKRLYGPTDLIASTGGLLGLCVGASVLSFVEAVYFLTIRLCFKYCKRRETSKNIAANFVTMLLNKAQNRRNDNVVNLNEKSIPIYDMNPNSLKFPVPTISVNNLWHPHQQ